MKIRERFVVLLAAAAGATCAVAVQAGTVTVRISGVHSAAGNVGVSLCGDAAAPFPGGCTSHSGMSPAKQGEVLVRIPDVADGTYAVQAFHDENGDFRPQIPPEGYAFGNDSPFPTSFKAAAVQIKGDTGIALTMTYISGPAGQAQATRAAPLVLPAGVTRIDLREGGLYGTLLMPEGTTNVPALVLIGGSEGGVETMSQMATSFAAEGFATLALAYWNAPGLPQSLENIPLEYFDRAIAWLRKQPRVAGNGIGLLGWSRGSEAALLEAVRNPAVHAVVGVAPSSVVWPGLNFRSMGAKQPAWTLRGNPLPSVALDSSGYSPDAPLAAIFNRSFPDLDQHAEAVIAVERIRGGVLLITGGADRIWPAMRFADRIGARLQATGFRHAYQHLYYPDAGHGVFVGAPQGAMASAMAGTTAYLGGTAESNAAAWADNWPRTLEFLRTQLQVARP
jgi:dienelactone hydrolase/uncharacterized protein (DUF2141 family)